MNSILNYLTTSTNYVWNSILQYKVENYCTLQHKTHLEKERLDIRIDVDETPTEENH